MNGAAILLADGRVADAGARILRAAEAATARAGDLLPLAEFLALGPAQRAGLGAWLAPEDEPAALASHLGALTLIAVEFPSVKDGRGYSTAALLRSRYRYRGDLRAFGDIQLDQLFYLRRVGFSSFALRADQDPRAAAAALRTFSDVYQGSVDEPLPYFRRRALTAVAGR